VKESRGKWRPRTTKRARPRARDSTRAGSSAPQECPSARSGRRRQVDLVQRNQKHKPNGDQRRIDGRRRDRQAQNGQAYRTDDIRRASGLSPQDQSNRRGSRARRPLRPTRQPAEGDARTRGRGARPQVAQHGRTRVSLSEILAEVNRRRCHARSVAGRQRRIRRAGPSPCQKSGAPLRPTQI